MSDKTILSSDRALGYECWVNVYAYLQSGYDYGALHGSREAAIHVARGCKIAYRIHVIPKDQRHVRS